MKKKCVTSDSSGYIGLPMVLSIVPSQFLNGPNQRESPHFSSCGDPIDPNSVSCPWCGHRSLDQCDIDETVANAKKKHKRIQDGGICPRLLINVRLQLF